MDISEFKNQTNELENRANIRLVEIEKQKAQMHAIFDSVVDGIMVFDMEYNVVMVNDAEVRITGYKSTEELKKNYKYFSDNFELRTLQNEILPIDSWPLSRIMKGETLKDIQLKGRRKDTGKEWYFCYSGEPVFNDQGEQILSVCITRDITLLKHTEEEQSYVQKDLANSESRYRYLFMNNPLPMFVYDQSTLKFLDVNESALDFYGYTREEFLTLTLEKIRPYGNDKHLRKDGLPATVEIHGHDLYFENKKSHLVLIHDVTDREEAEKSLKETVDKLEQALKNVSDYKFALDQASILATTDAAGVITYVNDKFCEISKFTREEIIGRTHRIVNSGYHTKEFFKEFWDTIQDGKVWRGEFCNKAKDGTIYWVDTVVVPFLDVSGIPYQYVAVRNDITDRKANQEALEEAINSRDEFLSIASHELKTPLTSLKLHSQMAIKHKEKPERIQKFLEQTDKQIQRLIVLVDDMLDISRIATGKLSIQKVEVNLVHLVQDVVERLHNLLTQSGCTIHTNLPHSCVAECDRFRIEQVVINLLTNAVKYGSGRPIHIELICTEIRAHLNIHDQGIGIAEDDIARIFQRFERAISPNEVSGLGLGLYISNQIVKMHDGTINVKSELGKGSTFTIELPLHQKK
jgi:PAS domain S-box-containing protein